MNRHFFAAAFSVGAAAVVWVALGYITSHPLALVMTLVIGAVYGVGALELLQFHRATTSLTTALANIPDNLTELQVWLGTLHPSLQNAVRLRVEGERTGLPGPALTPYLVGLLVMLGMLGTFLGMVVTLNGAVFALEGTTDLQAIRSSLAAPIKGLGLAFGTSLAGVAASAMLGLISALVRRDRLHAGQVLDGKIATVLRSFSLTHQRQETFKALQLQAQALPGVVDTLQSMMTMMERQSQQLQTRLLSNQDDFHAHIQGVYTGLARSVDQSLQDSLTHSARLAGETIKPLAEATLSGMAREASLVHERLLSTTQTQLNTLTTHIDASAATMAQSWTSALAQQDSNNAQLLHRVDQSLHAFSETFAQRSADLVNTVGASFAASQAHMATDQQHQLAGWTQSLESMASTLQREWQQTGAHTLAEITRLLDTAAEAPRAAADVIAQLRQELSASMVRDNAMLEERSRILETLSTLLDAIHRAAAEQRSTMDALVASSAHVTSSAVEVASLGESFQCAVQLFSDANEKLIANLQRIETAMDKSMVRSDDQLAYYVAQAREIMDLSIMSQKDVLDDLRKLGRQQAALAHEVG